MAPALRRRLGVGDVVQETFARAYVSLGRFEWQGESSLLGQKSQANTYLDRALEIASDFVLARWYGGEPKPDARADKLTLQWRG